MTIQRSDYGCGDNSCIFGSTGGMATNGGCRCLSEMPRHALTDRLRVQRGIMALRERLAEDAKVRAGLVAALREFVEEHSDGSFVEAGPEMMERATAALAAAKERK